MPIGKIPKEVQRKIMHQSIGPKAFLLPSPAVLAAAYDKEGREIVVEASWIGVCSSQPPIIGLSLKRRDPACMSFLEKQAVTVNIPSRSMAAQVDFVGQHTGQNLDVVKTLDLQCEPSEHVDAPMLLDCPVIIDLALQDIHTLGSHSFFFGEVLDVKVRQDCLRADGIPDPEKIDPLIFIPLAREFWSLGTFVAKTFSAGHTLRNVCKR
ncbi:MAG: flavin reductase family protein [Desulfovibrionaceae bacterium]|nr:flavin reductase family protein [Desulfovibrionaceae bacterium]